MEITWKGAFYQSEWVKINSSWVICYSYNNIDAKRWASLASFDRVDFEDYVTIKDKTATYVIPEPEAIFDEIFSTTMRIEDFKVSEMDGKEDDDWNYDKSERYPTLKTGGLKNTMEQLKDFASEKWRACLFHL